ncbi:MAG: hypothetical protein L6V81_00750 [Clostridium sp.]|nr:MAG: hypothetical protein L6V81_00750 [Clostridium sp.]
MINTSKVEGCEALTECAIKISYNHSDEYFARVYNIDKKIIMKCIVKHQII